MTMLWDGLSDHLVVVDLEDVRWLKRFRAFEPTSSNTRHGHRLRVGRQAKAPVQLGCRLHLTALKPMENLFFSQADCL